MVEGSGRSWEEVQTVVARSMGTSGIVAVLGVRGGSSGCGSDGGEHPVKGREARVGEGVRANVEC